MNFEKLFKLNEELKELEKMDPRPHSYIREKLMEIANEAELLREAMLGPNGNA